MLNLTILYIDTNDIELEKIMMSPFLHKEDIAFLSKFKNEEVKKEKACSFIIKNKYIGEYHLNEHGKPISDKAYFNISHSKGVVTFIKSDSVVGIDIEKIRPYENDLLDYISSREEKEYVKNDINFFEIWTNKESLVKAIGTGLRDNIKEIPALPINGLKEYKNKTFYVRTIEYKGYVISITRETNKPFETNIIEESV